MRVGDATGEEMLKAEEALDSIGVAIRDKATGNMREFDDIIKDLAGRWDNLTEAERNYIGDAMGGARQLNYVLALMKLHTEDVGNGMTRYQEIMASATNSSGEALNAQLNFANSIEGRLNSLSATANKFWNNLISSSAVKGAIGGLTSLIGALDKTVEIFGSGTIAILGFTALLSPLITKVYALAKANGILSVAQQALNVVMSMNPVLAVVSALGALLVTIGFVANACDNTTEKIEKMTQASAKFKVANENTTNISGDLEKYVAIQEELEYQTQTIEERNQLEAESATLLDNLVGYNEQSSNIMRNQIYTLEQKEALMKNMLEMEKQTQLKELNKEMMSQKKAIKNYEKLSKTIEKYNDLKYKMWSGEEEDYFHVQAGKLNDYKETILEAYKANMTYNDSVLLMGDSAEQFGHKLVDIPPELQEVINEILGIEEASEGMTDELSASEKAFGDLSAEAQASTSGVNELQLQMADWNVDGVIDAKDEMIRLYASIDDTKTAMENLSDTFKSFENPIAVSTKVIEELNETGRLTDDTWNNVIESGNVELIAGLWLDAGEAKKYYADLNKKLIEGREELANAEIMYSALEMGLIEENSEAYKMIKQAEAEFVKNMKQQEIADLEAQLNEKYNALEQEITEEHNKRLESCQTAYEVAQEKYRYEYELQQNRLSLANETNEAMKQIESSSGEDYNLALQSQVEAERKATEDKKAEYEKDKANFVEKAKEKDAEQERVIQSGKEKLTAFVNQAKSNYSSDASSFVSSVNIKESKLATFIRKLNQASSAVRTFNSLNVKSFNPTGSGNAGGGGVAKSQSINSREFTPVSPKAKSNNVEAMANTEAVNTSAVAPTSNEGAVATPSSTSANGSSGGGNSSGGDGSSPIGGNYDVMPTAIVGGVQHSNPDEGSSGKSSAKKAKELASANKDLTSSVSKLNKELEIELDRYYKLNDVLSDYDAILEEIRDAQEYATAEESYDLQKQELEIMAKQIGIYRQLHGEQLKELEETKNILIQNGFLVDSYGNLINSQEKLGELVNWANSSGSDENKDHVKYLEKLVDLYTELSNKSIPDTLDAIRDLNNEINGIAIDNLTNLRKKLIDALESEREAQKEQEIGILDARIEELQKEIDKLEDDSDDKYAKRSKLEAEIRKWQKDDSVTGKSKVKELTEELKELNKEITKSELQNQIDEIEATKESVEETYDDLLSEKSLYEEANRLMTTGSIEEMKALLESQSQDWEDIGVLWGKSFSEAFDKEIRNAMESLSYLKGESNSLVNGQDTSSPTSPTPPTPSPQPAQPQQPVTVVSKGSRVKVTDVNATIYRDSYTSRGSGTWKGAGVSNGDTLYVVNDSNGRVALSRTQSISGAIGWIEKKKVSAFDTGGYTGDFSGGRLGFLHQKEYVLNQAQTSAWLKLVPMLTELVKTPFLDMAKLFNGIINSDVDNPEVTITNNIEINNNSNVDMEKTNKGFEQLVREQLRKYGRVKK